MWQVLLGAGCLMHSRCQQQLLLAVSSCAYLGRGKGTAAPPSNPQQLSAGSTWLMQQVPSLLDDACVPADAWSCHHSQRSQSNPLPSVLRHVLRPLRPSSPDPHPSSCVALSLPCTPSLTLSALLLLTHLLSNTPTYSHAQGSRRCRAAPPAAGGGRPRRRQQPQCSRARRRPQVCHL